MFYTFDQSNPSGIFIEDRQKGIALQVCIEAPNLRLLQACAEMAGLYFYRECSCCGPRWSMPFDEEMSEFPCRSYEKTALTLSEDGSIPIHYMDESIKWAN